MAVTRTEKEEQLASLEGALKGIETAILVDYRGLDVPQLAKLDRFHALAHQVLGEQLVQAGGLL